MDKEEIIFNPEMPLAHYEKGHKLYLNYKRSVEFATGITFAALPIGFRCIMYAPTAMAIFFATALPFTLLAMTGCHARRPKACLFSAPLALIAAFSAISGGETISILGLIAYVAAAFAVFMAARSISEFIQLKDLPGYPVFDASLDDASFATMNEIGADEMYADTPIVYEEVRGKRFIAPLESSEDMEEILTVGMAVTEEEKALTAYEREMVKEFSDVPEDLRDEVAMSLGHLTPNLAEYEKTKAEERTENSDRAYEKMLKVQQGKNNNDISDVDLFE